MPPQSWTLTDLSTRTWLEKFSVSSADSVAGLPGSPPWSLQKSVLHGGLSDGVDLIDVDNGCFSVSILPTRGMSLWRGHCDGLNLGWKSPVQWPVHPAFVNAHERGGIGWLNGFNEWFCRCGLDANGPPEGTGTGQTTLHGRIANLPAHRVVVDVDPAGPGRLSVTGIVDECTLFGPALQLKSTISTALGSRSLTVIDEVTNLRGAPGEFELLYHINQGRPFLEGGAQLVAPILEVCPRNARAAEGMDTFDQYLEPAVGYVEQVYFYDLAADAAGNTGVLLKRKDGSSALGLRFNKRELPYFIQWKNTQAEADGYCTGLEPAINYPNAKSFEREHGRVKLLQPGETYRTEIEITVYPTAAAVQSAEQQIQTWQGTRPPIVHSAPLPRWASA